MRTHTDDYLMLYYDMLKNNSDDKGYYDTKGYFSSKEEYYTYELNGIPIEYIEKYLRIKKLENLNE
jgi:hypothetical protein